MAARALSQFLGARGSQLLPRRVHHRQHGMSWMFYRNAGCLVVAEVDSSGVKGATWSAITAAARFEEPVSVLVAGMRVESAAQEIRRCPTVAKVLWVESPSLEHAMAEPFTRLLLQIQEEGQFSYILAPSSTFGRNLLPRTAALLDVSMLSDVSGIVDEHTVVRPIYAGNAICTVRMPDQGPHLLTIRSTAFPAAQVDQEGHAELEIVDWREGGEGEAVWVREEKRFSGRPELGSAKVVVAGGRGVKSAQNFKTLEALADKLKGAVGASRAAVDAGYVPNDLQVGQTGKVVAPELYIAVGISGAIQHLAGMKDSKTIVAINKDKEAPIFEVADYGLVTNLFDAVPELTSKLP